LIEGGLLLLLLLQGLFLLGTAPEEPFCTTPGTATPTSAAGTTTAATSLNVGSPRSRPKPCIISLQGDAALPVSVKQLKLISPMVGV
jgi:hypothetical protein